MQENDNCVLAYIFTIVYTGKRNLQDQRRALRRSLYVAGDVTSPAGEILRGRDFSRPAVAERLKPPLPGGQSSSKARGEERLRGASRVPTPASRNSHAVARRIPPSSRSAWSDDGDYEACVILCYNAAATLASTLHAVAGRRRPLVTDAEHPAPVTEQLLLHYTRFSAV